MLVRKSQIREIGLSDRRMNVNSRIYFCIEVIFVGDMFPYHSEKHPSGELIIPWWSAEEVHTKLHGSFDKQLEAVRKYVDSHPQTAFVDLSMNRLHSLKEYEDIL